MPGVTPSRARPTAQFGARRGGNEEALTLVEGRMWRMLTWSRTQASAPVTAGSPAGSIPGLFILIFVLPFSGRSAHRSHLPPPRTRRSRLARSRVRSLRPRLNQDQGGQVALRRRTSRADAERPNGGSGAPRMPRRSGTSSRSAEPAASADAAIAAMIGGTAPAPALRHTDRDVRRRDDRQRWRPAGSTT